MRRGRRREIWCTIEEFENVKLICTTRSNVVAERDSLKIIIIIERAARYPVCDSGRNDDDKNPAPVSNGFKLMLYSIRKCIKTDSWVREKIFFVSR